MPEYAATLVAALIGAILGSVGAVGAQHVLLTRTRSRRRRELLVRRYLFQYHDAVESLAYRLRNLAHEGGKGVMSGEYFELTTLYAFGRVLALERILTLEGLFPIIETAYPGLGEKLQENRLDSKLQGIHFHRYDRIALAEFLIEREGGRFRPMTFSEFRRRYEEAASLERQWLSPALASISTLNSTQMDGIRGTLTANASSISTITKVRSTLLPRPA
jgi:hypothetical protein